MVRTKDDAQARVRIEKVESNLRFSMIDLDKQGNDGKIPFREKLARTLTPFNSSFLSFCKLKLELRDEDLEDEKFQLDEPYQNSSVHLKAYY